MVLALWDRARLAEDSGVEDGGGWGGTTLALNFGSPAEVDAAIEEARVGGREDRPRAGRDLLGRLQRRLRRPRRPPLGGRPQPALDGHRGRRHQAWLRPPARRAHLNLVESSRRLFELDPGAEIEAGEGWLFGAGTADHPAISNAAFRLDDELDPAELHRARPRVLRRQRPRLRPLGAGGRRGGRRPDRGGGSGRPAERLRDAGDDPRRGGRGASARGRGRACAGWTPRETPMRTGGSQRPPTRASASRRRSSPTTRGSRSSPARTATRPPSSPTSTASRSASR